jgi:threonylcarbamoyladenosine tRNA methylthiotransferase MtaB
MKYSLLTFGCRVNQADSMAIERDLSARGGVAASAADADVIVVNSCSVTATADQGTRQAIRRAARENPAARIIVTGCYATRCPEDVASLPGVVAVVPNTQKETLVATHVPFLNKHALAGTVPKDGPYLLDRTALAIRVQTGCEESCSYCIIPYTRGKSTSRSPSDLVAQLQQAERDGFLQVTLTGVHLGAYGRDLTPPSSLDTLLRAAADATSRVLLKLGSLEPMDVPPALAALALAGRLAPAFHLPLQHASDRLLARMRRPYTLAHYARTVDRLREQLPHAALGSDIIVGFPGETEEDFDTLCRYLEASPLTTLHVFPYSDRPGTEATSMTDKVPGPIVRERGRRIRDIGHRLAARFRASQAGALRPALTIEDGSVAVTDNGFRVPVGAGHRRNQRLVVAIPPEIPPAAVHVPA